MQVSPFGEQVRPQRPHSYTWCCFLRALHQANSDTCLLRSHVKAPAKSSSEHDRRPGLQKVLPCPDQQQDGVCRFPPGHRRQLFSECESSKCCGCDRANSCKIPRLYSQEGLALPPLAQLSIHPLHWLLPLSKPILHIPHSACPTCDRAGEQREVMPSKSPPGYHGVHFVTLLCL